MAEVARLEGMLWVPNGDRPLKEHFVVFLWDRGISVFLVKNEWVSQPESEQTGLGLRIAPGIC